MGQKEKRGKMLIESNISHNGKDKCDCSRCFPCMKKKDAETKRVGDTPK